MVPSVVRALLRGMCACITIAVSTVALSACGAPLSQEAEPHNLSIFVQDYSAPCSGPTQIHAGDLLTIADSSGRTLSRSTLHRPTGGASPKSGGGSAEYCLFLLPKRVWVVGNAAPIKVTAGSAAPVRVTAAQLYKLPSDTLVLCYSLPATAVCE